MLRIDRIDKKGMYMSGVICKINVRILNKNLKFEYVVFCI